MKGSRLGAALLGALLVCPPASADARRPIATAAPDELGRPHRSADGRRLEEGQRQAGPAGRRRRVPPPRHSRPGRPHSRPSTEARTFLADRRADKRRAPRRVPAGRAALHDALHQRLAGAADARGRQQLPGPPRRAAFESWLRSRLGRNAGYDEMVRDLLTWPIDRTPASGDGSIGGTGPGVFYLAKEIKPENLAGGTASRLFLGVSSSAPSATTTPSPSGSASSSGASPPSSPASSVAAAADWLRHGRRRPTGAR